MTQRVPARIASVVGPLQRVEPCELSETIEALRSQGKDILNLYGSPYWLTPGHVLEAAERAARENQVSPSKGFPELRQAIADKMASEGIAADPRSEILVTNGAMHALSLVFTTLLDAGSEVLMYRPSFFFFGLIELAGAVPVYADTRQEDGWRWNVKALEDSISVNTKMIVINTPTNPTGYVASEDDLKAVAHVARKHDLIVVSDESYDNMVYAPRRHVRLASLPEVKDRTITICSCTKTFAMQPWRVGFILASSHLTEHIQKVLEWSVLRCSHVSQRAAQAALQGPQAWMSQIAVRFQRGRDLMVKGIKSVRGMKYVIPEGGPFLFLNVSELGLSGTQFSHWLLSEFGVPTDPGAFFISDSHVRLPFGGEDNVVEEAARRICAASRKALDAQRRFASQPG
jgi:aspartate/methionine/tyrosine aminotransferase